MSENMALANPRSVDSTPTSADQEDHVSVACHAARRLLDTNDTLGRILGIELLTATQGVRFCAPLRTVTALRCALARLRAHIPELTDDRCISPDLDASARVVRSGALIQAVGPDPFLKSPHHKEYQGERLHKKYRDDKPSVRPS
jgi:histidine ammonia-lyase